MPVLGDIDILSLFSDHLRWSRAITPRSALCPEARAVEVSWLDIWNSTNPDSLAYTRQHSSDATSPVVMAGTMTLKPKLLFDFHDGWRTEDDEGK